jgi:hypothetical protein
MTEWLVDSRIGDERIRDDLNIAVSGAVVIALVIGELGPGRQAVEGIAGEAQTHGTRIDLAIQIGSRQIRVDEVRVHCCCQKLLILVDKPECNLPRE